MAGKKKDKKPAKETKEQISAVDKTFYELAIADLNKKLANARAQNAQAEERSNELETKLAQLEEDHADITAYLSRALNTQTNSIKDFEEKLEALAKVRSEESLKFQAIISDWESKYKTMHEQLTSEIKLLTGKLNSLEEFRIQKDDLMAKFDLQETELREQSHRHKETLHEMEKRQIIDKNQLKNEVERRLLQLSDEFARSNAIRVAAHVQRMVRENIALSNEIDRILFTVERLRGENKTITEQNEQQRLYAKSLLDENAFLVDTNRKRLAIIERLTVECERLKATSKICEQLEKQRQVAEMREVAMRKELNECKRQMNDQEKNAARQEQLCRQHLADNKNSACEIERIRRLLFQLKQTVRSVLDSDATDADEASMRAERRHLLDEMMTLLTNEVIIVETMESHENGVPLSLEQGYRRGRIGLAPIGRTSQHLLKYSHSSFKGRRKSFVDASDVQTAELRRHRQSIVGCPIIDADDERGLLETADSIRDDDNIVDDQTIAEQMLDKIVDEE